MYLLLMDETNVSPKDGKFFVYGGLIIPFEKIDAISDGIAQIRKDNNYDGTDSLKFNTTDKPTHISSEQISKIKNLVCRVCIDNECVFLAQVVWHEIANQEKLVEYGANTIIDKFNNFLKEKADTGIVIMDRLENVEQYAYLKEKFSKGLIYPKLGAIKPLTQIKLFASSCNNASHLSSAADIVLGMFRYSICNPLNKDAASVMVKDVSKLIWGDRHGESIDPFKKGLSLRPVTYNLYRPDAKKEFEDLVSHINTLLK